MLAICRDNLAPNGVAFVSYNTLPGWHMRGMIRDMMVYHSSQFQGATQKVRQARALLDFLAQSTPTTTSYGMTLRQELDAIRNEPDAYLFHDHLEEINDPFYFHQFADAARRHELQYLAEADFGDMLLSKFPPKVAETLTRIAQDVIRMEQYMDFVRNRLFRQTLLVHRGAPIWRKVDGRMVKGLLVSSAVKPESAAPVLTQGVSEAFKTPSGTHAHHRRCADQGRVGDALEVLAALHAVRRARREVPRKRRRGGRRPEGRSRCRRTTCDRSANGCCRAMRYGRSSSAWRSRG